MNRLRDQWKKRPWLPGRTIDLGEHEWAFLQETGLSSRPGPVAPAVLDWLRWKYRRLQIDRKRDNEWVRVLHDDLPGRLRAAGSPSDNESAALEQTRAQHAFVPWTVDNETLPTFSRRKQVDAPRLARAKPDHPFGSTGKRGRPRRLAQPSPEAVAELCYRHHKLLNRLFDKCRDQGEKSAVIAALSEYEANPMDPKVVGRWANLVRELNEPGR